MQEKTVMMTILILVGFLLLQTASFRDGVPMGTGFQTNEPAVTCSGFKEDITWTGVSEIGASIRQYAAFGAKEECKQSWSEKRKSLETKCYNEKCKVPPCAAAGISPKSKDVKCVVDEDKCIKIRRNLIINDYYNLGFSYLWGWKCPWTATASFECVCYEHPIMRSVGNDVAEPSPPATDSLWVLPEEDLGEVIPQEEQWDLGRYYADVYE